MKTQTDSAEMKDFQIQVNLERAYVAIEHQAVQTIKTEIDPNIHMPNIPNSSNRTQSKKRKLSSSRAATTPTQNDSSPVDSSILNICNHNPLNEKVKFPLI